MTTCYGYTRVSTAKQGEGVSLEAQKDEIIRYAQKHDLIISHWFEEKETAATAGRPIFNAIVQDLLDHKADGLIVHKIDRSARNFRDWAKIGELSDQGIAIHFASESLDFQSRGGRLTADIQAVIASDYIRNLREEAKKGIRGRLKQGLYPFRAPIGYLDNGKGLAKTPDPKKAPLIKELFDLYLSGNHGIRSLQVEMTERGLRNVRGGILSRHGIETILSNPFYYGSIRIKRTGDFYNGIHEPLISASVFQKVQDLKAGKCGKKTSRHMFRYRGLFKCQLCKLAMIAERQKGNVYYRCHNPECPTKGIREEEIERALELQYSQKHIRPKELRNLIVSFDKWSMERETGQKKATQSKLRLGQLEARQSALTDALIDGLIEKEEFTKRKETLCLKIMRIREEQENSACFEDGQNYLRKFLELVNNLDLLYQLSNPIEKRLFVELTTSNRTIRAKTVVFEPSNWLIAAQNVLGGPVGAPQRPTSRTLPKAHIRALDELLELVTTVSQRELHQDMMDIFDKYIGNVSNSED